MLVFLLTCRRELQQETTCSLYDLNVDYSEMIIQVGEGWQVLRLCVHFLLLAAYMLVLSMVLGLFSFLIDFIYSFYFLF